MDHRKVIQIPIQRLSNVPIVSVDVRHLPISIELSFILVILGTRSRGSITMRMLMGASDIYADGKVQATTPSNST